MGTRGRARRAASLILLAGLLLQPGAGRAEPAVSAATLREWHRLKDAGGPTFAGSPAWREHVQWVEAEFRRRELATIERESFVYRRWWTSDDPAAGRWGLTVAGRSVPVANYWAYSGSTPASGVEGRLVRYRPDLPADITRGAILVFEVPPLPRPLPPVFAAPGHEYATPDLAGIDRDATTRHWYQVNYATRFGGLGDKLKAAGALGGLVVFDMGPERARGLYTFPLLKPGEIGVPALYLDRNAGAAVLAAADAGQSARLTLDAERAEAETWFLSAVLPGRHFGSAADEFVLLITHTDGPNLTQENGALGILAMVDELRRQPVSARDRSVLIVLDPQHYMPGRHQVDWFERHPDIARRIVASVGVEQLGQREYVETGAEFRPSGLPEISILFSQDDPALIGAARSAIVRHGLPRTELRVPARRGQGRWMGLGEIAVEKGWPGFALNTDMSAYWAVGPGLASFDADLAVRQVGVLTDLTRLLLTGTLPVLPRHDPGPGRPPE